MRSSFPSRDELSRMSLAHLRTIDVRDKEEEDLLQEFVDSKYRQLPPESQIYRGDVPDIKNAEQEAEWQKIIDERAAKLKAVPTVDEEIAKAEETLEAIKEELVPEVSTEPIVEPVDEPVVEEPKVEEKVEKVEKKTRKYTKKAKK